MDIKKVAVLGAGAVGSYVIWGLSNNKNITLGVVQMVREMNASKTKD